MTRQSYVFSGVIQIQISESRSTSINIPALFICECSNLIYVRTILHDFTNKHILYIFQLCGTELTLKQCST